MASLDSEVLGKDYLLIWIMPFTFPYDRFFFIPFNKQIIILHGAKLIQLLCFFFYFLRMARLFCCKFSKTKMWAVLGLRLFNFAAIWPVFPSSCVPNRH